MMVNALRSERDRKQYTECGVTGVSGLSAQERVVEDWVILRENAITLLQNTRDDIA